MGIYPEKDLAKSLFDRAEDCFEASADIKFFENAVQVALDRLFADKTGEMGSDHGEHPAIKDVC